MAILTPSSHRAPEVAVAARIALIAAAMAVIGFFAVLPVAPASAASVSSEISQLERSGAIDAAKADKARRTYRDARSVRRKLRGSRRRAMNFQIRTIERLARSKRITGDRVTPLFEMLRRNTNWFRSNGPRAAGTRMRFGSGKDKSRIYFQYFPGQGWQFHPLANFAKLNAVWTVKKKAARRALRKYAHELIDWGVNRGGALTWEYYFPFSGSSAPFISSISQGTAIQSLARAGKAVNDPTITAAARQAMLAFDTPVPVGLKLKRDIGNHYIGYSGNRRLIILNMFLQSLDGLHDFAIITGDAKGWDLYREGLKAARRETVESDTGAWSLYSLGGRESNLHYHNLLTGFLSKLCNETKEEVFCHTRNRFSDYKKRRPMVRHIKTKQRGRKINVYFRLSKLSTVTVSLIRRGDVAASRRATVGYGKRRFGLHKPRKRGMYTLKIRAVGPAGNVRTKRERVRIR